MTSIEQWQQIERVLDVALETDPSEWDALLDRMCSEDAALREAVEQLLSRHASARSFLESPPIAVAAALVADARHQEDGGHDVGRRIGAYRLLRQIGRGGMSRVYLAERADGEFEQQVAIKLLRPGLDSDIDHDRFRAERQILAALNHPNIARLLDGGITSEGAPYLVLEYVDGQPLDVYCETNALDVSARIGLVQSIAEATQHAHRSLVVHRDLKPSNILVSPDGVVKLLDFGIAKLLDGATASELATQTAHRWMTPEYAAPEQIRGEPITTATDVYQLGAVLYELLAGVLPFGRRGASVHGLEAAVLRDAPPLPSVAGNRPALRGDLDAIVMQAMRKEPDRRYQSAQALVEDLQRYREGRPVRAHADSRGYRLRKFVGRHRTGVAAATVLMLTLIGASVREGTLRARAEGEARKARAVEDYLVSIFAEADPYAPPKQSGGDLTARAILDRGATRIDSALSGQPEVQAELRQVLGHLHLELGMYDKAAPILLRALDQRRALYGPNDTTVAQSMDSYARALARQDQLDKAEPLLREALATRERLLGNASSAATESAEHLAQLLQDRGQSDSAETLFRRVLSTRRAVTRDSGSQLALSLNNLGLLLWRKGKFDQADTLYREALDIEMARLGENRLLTAQTIHNLAQLQESRGRYPEAESLYSRALGIKRRILGDTHPSVTVNLNNLGIMMFRYLGKTDEAEPLIREAYALDRHMFGDAHSYTAASLANLATVLQGKGDFTGADSALQRALRINRGLYGKQHSMIAFNLNNLAGLMVARGQAAEGVTYFQQARDQYEGLFGKQHLYYKLVSVNLARSMREAGQAREAEQELRRVASTLDTAKAPERAQYIASQVSLGLALIDLTRPTEAEPVLAQAVTLSAAHNGKTHWKTGEARLALATAMLRNGKRAAAATLLREAYEEIQPQRRGQPRLIARAESVMEAAGVRLPSR